MKSKLLYLFIAIFFVINLAAQNPMCIIGDATKYGWDKDKSSPLTQDGLNPSKFYYSAWLNAGSFKFLKQNSDWVPSWNKGADETSVIKRVSSSDPDAAFTVATSGNYNLVLDTAAMTLNMTAMTETTPIPFNTLFIVGSASPNGWDVGKSIELIRNETNPFEFSYNGEMAIGEFKFPVNRNWGWNQDFFMKTSDTNMFLGTSPDSKWNISEAGSYTITINVSSLTINIQKNITSVNDLMSKNINGIVSTLVTNEIILTNRANQTYQVYGLTGGLMISGTTNDGSIDVSELNSGVYLLKVENTTLKFIKK